MTLAATKPRQRPDLTVVELDGEAVIYDEASGDLHHLNPTATIVFGLCDGSYTMREMAADISDAFQMPAAEIESQVRALIRQFRKANLLATTNGRGRDAERSLTSSS